MELAKMVIKYIDCEISWDQFIQFSNSKEANIDPSKRQEFDLFINHVKYNAITRMNAIDRAFEITL